MHTTTSFDSAPTAARTPSPVQPGRRVIDAPIRMFHWLFALSFAGAYLTAEGEHWRALHVTLGYTMAGLLAFRVAYGIFGPRQASLGAMARKVAGAPAWIRSAAHAGSLGGINWRQGQNLLMAAAVITMLVWVLPLTLSGYGSYNDWGDFLGGDWLEELHEFFGNTFLLLVLAHLALILVLSVLRGKNQALPMLTGRADGPGPNLVQNNRAWLAVLLLLAVLAFGVWQWQESPQGLISAQALSSTGSGHGDDDD